MSSNEERTRKRFEVEKREIVTLIEQGGCPICRAVEEAMQKQWFWFFNESYGAGEGVGKYINFYGFCEKHTTEVAKRGPAWQKTAIYDWIITNRIPQIEEILAVLNEGFRTSNNRIRANFNFRKLKKALSTAIPKGSCLMCDWEADTSKRRTEDLLSVLTDTETSRKFEKSDGLCIKHFFTAFDFAEVDHIIGLQEITKLQIAKLRELKTDLAEYFRKGDYRFANEPKGKEQTAWARAMNRFVGSILHHEVDELKD
ncbi:MAG: DUF6062 family protein [Thaumarchaeota archaeon]|nr:DUF6062 family protein [Nitrososphaerota archaeon]